MFPSLELIGWYTITPSVTSKHIALHNQFTGYCATPLLLVLSSSNDTPSSDQALPFKAYEPTFELRERVSRVVFVEAPYTVETGEAERIAVDWTARGGGSGTSCAFELNL